MSGINYSQCWEDTHLLKKALAVTDDDIVLSITSGGDNTLALLLENPKKIYSVDINQVQNYLAELKLQSAKVLSYEQYLGLLGVTDSKKRTEYFNQVSRVLSKDANVWFKDNMELIEDGVIHSGKFEKYLNSFRKYLLPLVHSQQNVSGLVSQSSLQDQAAFYEKVWNTWQWRLFFSIATHPYLLQRYGRQAGVADDILVTNERYFNRMERLIYRSHLKTNYYLHYALTGQYGELLPEYLLEENYTRLRRSCEFKNEDVCSFLKKTSDNSLTKYNLSDTFEFLTIDKAVEVWKEILRTAKNGARVVYWCNQVEHVAPQEVEQSAVSNVELEKELKDQDQLYFYRSFHIYTISK